MDEYIHMQRHIGQIMMGLYGKHWYMKSKSSFPLPLPHSIIHRSKTCHTSFVLIKSYIYIYIYLFISLPQNKYYKIYFTSGANRGWLQGQRSLAGGVCGALLWW